MTLPTHAAITCCTQPAPIIWSNRMSEMGPISVRPRFFWRIISCPAANGIICSIWRPSATEAPLGTSSAIASCMLRSLDMFQPPLEPEGQIKECHHLSALPHRRALLEKGRDSLFDINGPHQILDIDFFRPRQPLV